jgi:hypothetical protein
MCEWRLQTEVHGRSAQAAKKQGDQADKTKPVRMDRGIIIKAKIAAADKGVDLAEYLSSVLTAPVERDWARARKKILEVERNEH